MLDLNELAEKMNGMLKAAQSSEPALELDIQKAVSFIRSEAIMSQESIKDFEDALHSPETLIWEKIPDEMFDRKINYSPSSDEVEFIVKLIATVNDGAEWHIPRTGWVYRINKASKTFTLLQETRDDPYDWHGRIRSILDKIGWQMLDGRATTRSFTARRNGWLFCVVDFSIEKQIDSSTGKNFPPGSRGQDAMATFPSTGLVLRLGHLIGCTLMKYVLPDFGAGKSTAGGSNLT